MPDMLRLTSIGKEPVATSMPRQRPICHQNRKNGGFLRENAVGAPRTPHPGASGDQRAARPGANAQLPCGRSLAPNAPRPAPIRRSPRLVPSSREGRGGGPTAQPTGATAHPRGQQSAGQRSGARLSSPAGAVRGPAARPARRLSQRDQRTVPAAGPAGGLTHLVAMTRTRRFADTSECRPTVTV